MAQQDGQDALDDLDRIDDGETVILSNEDTMEGGAQDTQDGGGDELEVVIDDGQDTQDGGAQDTQEGAGGEDTIEGGAEDDDVDPDLKGLPESTRKRVQRERRLRREGEINFENERRARAAAETRERAAVLFSTGLAIRVLEGDIKSAQGELIAAKEAGDTTKEVAAQTKLNELQMKKRDAETAKTRLEEQEEQVKSQADQGATQRTNPLTERWLGRNRWFGDERFKNTAAMVRAIDRQMVAEGFRANSEDFYIELDRRIHQEIPQLRSRIRSAGFGPRPQAPRGKPAGGGLPVRTQTRQAAAGGKNRIVLTRADLANMERFGMDSTNKEHQVEYARQQMKKGG